MKIIKLNIGTKRKGFSLVELLVASALFTIVVAVTAGSFITVLDASRQSRELNKLMLAVDFAMEDMSRTIRTGKNFSITNDNRRIELRDEDGERIIYNYSSSSEAVVKTKGTGPGPGDYQNARLTPEGIRITYLRFTGETAGNMNQPRIRINLVGVVEETGEGFHLQTSVTQRELNF